MGGRKTITPGGVVAIVISALVMLAVLAPLLWLFVSSFKSDKEVIAYPPTLLPQDWTLDQFEAVNHSLPIAKMFRNSLIFAGGVTVISLLLDSMAGYAFARLDFKHKKLWFAVVLLTMMVPFQILMTPLYIEEHYMGLLDTFVGLILPRATSAYGIYMMRSFFVRLPVSLEESGRLDGLSEFGIFRRIMLPQCLPALVALGVFHFMNNWNDLLYPLMLTSSTEMRTFSAGLAMLVGNKVIKFGPTLAATLISILPVLVLYMFGQRYFREGIASTGMKE
ncbi:MAG: carbohydrate ABC transporter permease [Bifidobacteriaceae bacterium]|jgi:multiple sugar transport system permease protein|nr:carbohydrate ABC transporter permease [Bifidobacteriaceae bacterium]